LQPVLTAENPSVQPPETAFHLYVHWPFCQHKCGYCDFASAVPKQRWDVTVWQKSYARDIANLKARTGDRQLGSIFFGGGTPSLAEPDLIGCIIDTAMEAWEPRANVEVTLEANPGTVDKKVLRALRDVGVNRLSVGAQSFLDEGLTVLGRKHSVKETKYVLEWAHDIFDRLSMDLITARPQQKPLEWIQELHEALVFAGEHLSIYQLTVEDGTPLARAVDSGRVRMLDDDVSAQIFEDTYKFMAEAGRPAYEVSNFAQPGKECRHNLAIWRGADYGGIGPAAHGRLNLEDGFYATEHTAEPLTWLKGPAGADWAKLSPEERAEEHMMMSLRLTEGLNFQRFTDLFKDYGYADPMAFLNQDALSELIDLGFLNRDDVGLRTTQSGVMLLNALTARLITTPSSLER